MKIDMTEFDYILNFHFGVMAAIFAAVFVAGSFLVARFSKEAGGPSAVYTTAVVAVVLGLIGGGMFISLKEGRTQANNYIAERVGVSGFVDVLPDNGEQIVLEDALRYMGNGAVERADIVIKRNRAEVIITVVNSAIAG